MNDKEIMEYLTAKKAKKLSRGNIYKCINHKRLNKISSKIERASLKGGKSILVSCFSMCGGEIDMLKELGYNVSTFNGDWFIKW